MIRERTHPEYSDYDISCDICFTEKTFQADGFSGLLYILVRSGWETLSALVEWPESAHTRHKLAFMCPECRQVLFSKSADSKKLKSCVDFYQKRNEIIFDLKKAASAFQKINEIFKNIGTLKEKTNNA